MLDTYITFNYLRINRSEKNNQVHNCVRVAFVIKLKNRLDNRQEIHFITHLLVLHRPRLVSQKSQL